MIKRLLRFTIQLVLVSAAPQSHATTAVTQNGSMDYPGGNREMAFCYNEWGALVMDESRGIRHILYDRSGNPMRISFTDGSITENVYSESGEKLITRYSGTLTSPMIPDSQTSPVPHLIQTVEYHGNVIYRDGKVDMVLFPGGYATINGSAVTFHYYTQDYLGNNRAVINGSTGAIEQTVAYYPFGGVIADLGTGQISGQPYKFGGNELITANGLNEYDFGARWYYQAVPYFTKPDPMCEKYYWLSPYLYCINDPVNNVDNDGKEVTLWATKLPGVHIPFATHTFITVSRPNKETEYFAYGSEENGKKQMTSGRLGRFLYDQDMEIYKNRGEKDSNVKAKIVIDPPEGMSQEDFDQNVIDVAKSFGNNKDITYNIYPDDETEGNCNSSTYTILFKAGVHSDTLKEIEKNIPGVNWGFGDLKPWTKDEQEEAVKRSQ